jgi:1-phosphofructokinase family hexose kinase
MHLDTLRPGAVNRALEVRWCASGKVLNAARAVHALGGPCKALTVIGGRPGEELWREFADLGIPVRWVETAAPTRICTTLVDAGQHTATELVENAHPLTAEEQAAFRTAYWEEAATARVVVLIGSLPPGAPPRFFRDLLAYTPGRAIVDAGGEALLLALPAKPFLVKPNRDELARTLGRALPTEAELFEAMRELNQRGAEWVLVTDGQNPTYVSSQGRLWRVLPLQRDVVNPIGCGDCLAGGLAWATFHGSEPLDAVRVGVAVAADKVGRLLPAEVDRERVGEMVQSVELALL